MLESSPDVSCGTQIGTLRIAPRDLVRLLEGFAYKQSHPRITRSWSLRLNDDIFDIYDWRTDPRSARPASFWADVNPQEFAVAALDGADLGALARELVRMATDRGVANVSLTRYP